MNKEKIEQTPAAILKARARVLAREPEKAAAAGALLEIIEFRLASETYGIESMFVREIHPLRELTPPCTIAA